jgi:putative transposase
VNQPSPWRDVTGQIYLGSPEFLDRIDRVVRSKSLANVPSAQGRPTRLFADEVLTHVTAAYRVRLGALLDRSHREAYQTAVYLLRRAANEPLKTVAIRFRIRVSHKFSATWRTANSLRRKSKRSKSATSRTDPDFHS